MSARYDWETIRAEYEAGATMGELSRRHGVDKAAISRRAKKEGWVADLSEVVNRQAEAKVNGIVNTVDPKKRAEAVDRASDAKAAVIEGQRESWNGFDRKVTAALEANDFDRLKCLKIASEALRNAQECQRRAWGIVDKSTVDMTSSDGSMTPAPAVVLDFSGMSPDDIAATARAAFRGE